MQSHLQRGGRRLSQNSTPGYFCPTAGRSCSLRNSTESSFQKRRTKDSAVFAFRKVQRSIFPIFFLLFLISYLQSSSASASISFTFSSFTADITFTLFSVQVIFLLFSNIPFMTLAAVGAQLPFSMRPMVRFW